MNVYFKINLGLDEINLKALKSKGLMNRYNLPHQNLHWRLSYDKTEAIVQAELTDIELAWLKKQTWATYLGDYVSGFAEKKVHDYISDNKVEWEGVII